MRRNLYKRVFLLIAYSLQLTAFLGGCGYTTRSMISDKYRTIYITPFASKIDITQETYSGSQYRLYKPGLETDVSKEVINKFLFDGNLKPVKKDSADLILKGELIEFRRDPLSYDDNDQVAEYRINVLVNLSLWDTKESKPVWEENGFTGYTTYFTSFATGTSITRKTDDAAVIDAVKDLARRIVERTVEEW